MVKIRVWFVLDAIVCFVWLSWKPICILS